MKLEEIQRAVFLTNTFAQAHPDEHVKRWAEFEKEVPAAQRTGVWGSDNLAYINWLKKKQDSLFIQFTQTAFE